MITKKIFLPDSVEEMVDSKKKDVRIDELNIDNSYTFDYEGNIDVYNSEQNTSEKTKEKMKELILEAKEKKV
jgi:hypothetical protein